MLSVPLEPLPILIVDDDENILRSLERDLRKINPCECFSDPTKALERFQIQNFAVVLCDFKMPQMTGLEFLEECSEIKPECQRILLTAYTDLADITELINRAKLNGFLTKPWEPKNLQSFIRGAIGNNTVLRENAQLRQLAWTDALTQVPNHRYFWERLESELSRAARFGRPLSLIMADIDNFKQFNDKYGHQHGDYILKKVALCLEGAKRQMDIVARYGGEEFAIILPETNKEQALQTAERLRNTCEKSTEVRISLGFASYPEHAQSSTELLHLADKALLEAKRKGKNQVVSADNI